MAIYVRTPSHTLSSLQLSLTTPAINNLYTNRDTLNAGYTKTRQHAKHYVRSLSKHTPIFGHSPHPLWVVAAIHATSTVLEDCTVHRRSAILLSQPSIHRS